MGSQWSAFRWVHDCKQIPEQVLAESWAKDLQRFMIIADETISSRNEWRQVAIERFKEQPKRKRRKVICPTDLHLYHQYPTPSCDPSVMIEALMVRKKA